MKLEVVLADKDVEARINAVVAAEAPKTRSAAMCSQMAAANLDRIRGQEEDGGCQPSRSARLSRFPPASAGTCRPSPRTRRR
eukprot:2505724-Prymnesium_polylepis.1